jgi:hypothetical protein
MEHYDPDLPEELQGRTPEEGDEGPTLEDMQRRAEERENRLNDINAAVLTLREDAVRARRESGIEQIWADCEDAYLGIDDLNRPAERGRWSKPTSMVGPVTKDTGRQANRKSTAFVRLTARYVDMGSAKISEIILPIDDKAFSFGPTPVPELAEKVNDTTPVQGPDGQPVMRPQTEEEQAAAQQQAQGMTGQPAPVAQPVQVTVGDIASKQLEKAKQSAEKAEKRIYDWHVESRYPMQMRKVIFDGARIGAGIIKGPYPEMRHGQKFSIVNGAGVLTKVSRVAPACKWINPWNFFPHRACGEDIHTGDYVFECDTISESTLRGLKEVRDPLNKPVYIGSQIDKVLAEGPSSNKELDGRNPAEANQTERNGQYGIWYFTGTIKRQDFLSCEPSIGDDDLPDDLQHVSCLVTMVNDTVIGATLNPMESGGFPYHVFQWSRRAGYWAGIGVGEQVSLPQHIVNAGSRRLLDNAGISSGAQIAVRQDGIVPADGNWDITPDKLWFMTNEAGSDDIRKVFMSVEFPNLGTQIMAVIQYGFKLAEEASNIPLISQGQTGPQDPQTFGQAELQNNNANSLLRNIAYNLDDCITEPMVNDFYEWLLMDPEVPDDEKGDFEINARGSIAMVEKAIQEQTLAMLGAMTLNPAYGMDPKRWAAEFVRVKRMDPAKLQYTEDEQKQMASQPPPEAPAVTAAKIRAASAEKIAGQRDQTTLQRAKMDTDRDTQFTLSLERRDATMASNRRDELAIKREIAYLELQIRRGISVDNNKTKLADTVMKLNTQKQMAAQVLKPPIEPPGRAPDGQSFQR